MKVGILLTGPPGCGKTLLAREFSKITKGHFEVVNGAEMMS
jgi:ATP-dependent 26S proteasome regulatory subunit